MAEMDTNQEKVWDVEIAVSIGSEVDIDHYPIRTMIRRCVRTIRTLESESATAGLTNNAIYQQKRRIRQLWPYREQAATLCGHPIRIIIGRMKGE